MTRHFRAAMLLVGLLAAPAWAASPEFVEPSELARRPELVGRDVVVDDRIRYFLESKRGQGFDELLLKRSEVLFRFPPRLRYARPPSEPNARVLGVLKVSEGRLVCDVSAIELLSNDHDRLEKELGKLRPEDFLGRRNWALWAERRGKELNDPKLEARGVALEAEALWLEADRPESDTLALATRDASRPIPEATRNALIHRGFRDRFSRSTAPADLEALARQVEATLPAAADPRASAVADSTWADAYARDPGVYRDAPGPIRAALDRRLLADILQRTLERQLDARPTEATSLAETARTQLPDRPEVSERLRQRGLDEAEARVATLRQSEAEELARTLRDQGQEERARRLLQNWLADRRRNRLSASDAEGRILLAGSYEKLLGDRAAAASLLREALVIDPQSKPATDAFLRMGFRKGDTGWYDPVASRATTSDPADPAGSAAPPVPLTDTGDSLRGLTRAQVRSRLGGKPDRVIRLASQGRCLEQWIYKNGKRTQVVNFPYEPGTNEPRASSNYSDER